MAPDLREKSGVRIAIEGCGHGTLHAIYASVAESCTRQGWPGVDLLIICGDFQAVRNAMDLHCVSMPAKYRAMHDFHEYYAGRRAAPYLTVFVGGNHEASNYLAELYYGGWVARDIYYMGAANVLRLGALRIAGLSGIFKPYNYHKPHHERLPYSEGDLKSIYHVRELDVRKLLHVRTQVDVGISHDWPKGVEWLGDYEQLFRRKKHLRPDAERGALGSGPANEAMRHLRPRLWFSAHLHCKYAAVIKHETAADSISTARAPAPSEAPAPASNTDEIDLGLDDTGPPPAAATPSPAAARAQVSHLFQRAQQPPPPPAITNPETRFLALDKCEPNRHFLQLLAVPTASPIEPATRPLQLHYDAEWLAITRAFALDAASPAGAPDHRAPPSAPRPAHRLTAGYATALDERLAWVRERWPADADLVVPRDFCVTAPVYDGGDWRAPQYRRVEAHANPQTAAFCRMLEIGDPFGGTRAA